VLTEEFFLFFFLLTPLPPSLSLPQILASLPMLRVQSWEGMDGVLREMEGDPMRMMDLQVKRGRREGR
jgi:hypothetical protein